MKAIERNKSGISVVDAPLPAKPKRGEILIEVHAASLNRADYATKPPAGGAIAGSDVAGVVSEVGEGVAGISVGDRVCAVTKGLKGGLAEAAIADAAWAARLPKSMDFAQGAAIPSAGVTALAAVRKVPSCSGARVLICGASGGVGQFATAFAKESGAVVTAACSAKNEAVARAAGADSFIDYKEGLGAIEAGCFDAIIAVNGSFPSSECCRVLKPGGTHVLVGADSLRPSVLTLPLRGRRLKAGLFFALIGHDGLRRAVELVERSGFIPTMDVVDGFDGAARALESLGHAHPRGKVVAVLKD